MFRNQHRRKNSHLAPAVADMHWVHGVFHLPSPILSLIEMTFKAGVDVQDISQPAGKMWRATIEYLQTLPKLEFLFWGPSTEKKENVYLFLQWEDAIGWEMFQKSFGIGLMVGLLATPVFNRALMVKVEFGFMRTLLLDVILLQFDAKITWEERDTIQRHILKIKTSSDERPWLATTRAWIHWLEKDVPEDWQQQKLSQVRRGIPVSEVGAIAAINQSTFLVALIPKKDNEDQGLETEILPLVSSARSTNRVTIDLYVEHPRPRSVEPFQPFLGHSTEALMKLLPRRQFFLESIRDYRQRDVVAGVTRDQPGLDRLFPAPYGSYQSMGNLNQYHPLKEKPYIAASSQPLLVVEVCWLQFKPRGPGKKILRSQQGDRMKKFLELGAELEEDSECEGVSWGHEEGNPDTLVVFICWKRYKSGMNIFNNFSNAITIERFISIFQDLATTPQVQRFPTCNLPSKMKLMELTNFYIPPGPLNKELFEEAYKEFQNTITFPGTFPNDRFACTSLYAKFGGWESDDQIFMRSNQEVRRFTGALSWNAKDNTVSPSQGKPCTAQEARAQWYKDFSDGVEHYERLGKYVDALRCLTIPGGVESRFVVDVQPISERVGLEGR